MSTVNREYNRLAQEKLNAPIRVEKTTNSDEGNHTMEKPVTAYLPKPGKSTGKELATWSGEMLPMGEYHTIIVPRQLITDAYQHGAQAITINAECVHAHDEENQRRRNAIQREKQRAENVLDAMHVLQEFIESSSQDQTVIDALTTLRKEVK